MQGSLLTFFGDCIRHGDSLEECKARVLKLYFPLFVREKMIWELVVFHFQERDCPLRVCVCVCVCVCDRCLLCKLYAVRPHAILCAYSV